MNRSRHRASRAWVLVAIVAGEMLLVADQAGAVPELTLEPAAGPAGSQTQASGCGWASGEVVEFLWDGDVVLGSAIPTSRADGCVSAVLTVPVGAPPGDHRVLATQSDRDAAASYSVTERPALIPDPRLAGLERLREAAGGEADAEFVASFPRAVFTRVVVPGENAVQRAVAFLAAYRDLYGQDGQRLGLRPWRQSRINRDPEVVVFQQYVDEVPVFGGQISVLLDGSEVLGTVGALLVDTPQLSTQPDHDVSWAEQMARTHLRAIDETPVVGDTRLVVVENGLKPGTDGVVAAESTHPHLAWQVALAVGSTEVALVDDATGELLLRYPLSETGYRLDLYDAKGDDFGLCPHLGVLPYDLIGATGFFAPPANDADAQEAWANARATYDYFNVEFGRDSYDDDGTRQRIVIRHPTDGTATSTACDTMLFNADAATRDIVTHEFTHAVDRYESNLVYSGQSGALDESFADVMAALDEGDWLIGEDVDPPNVFRNLADPPQLSGDPCLVGNSVPHPDMMSKYVNTSCDNGGVHYNSLIPSKAAFLMAQGQVFNGVNVAPMFTAKTERLVYATMTSLPQSLAWSVATFAAARHTAVIKAEAWAAKGTHGFTAQDVCTVKNAYAAVEIAGSGDSDCDGIVDDPDPDADNDGVPDATDNCDVVKNPGQLNKDGDSMGDACDSDADNDGVDNSADNCPMKANSNQADSDGDGIGNFCQDKDQDGALDLSDNCPTTSNANQKDSDGDGDGDACDTDLDGDGIANDQDNCPDNANPDQQDTDKGGIGDACDPDPTNPLNDSIARLKRITRMKMQPTPNLHLTIPLEFCAAGCPEEWLTSGTKAQLTVKAIGGTSPRGGSSPPSVWVATQEGLMTAQSDGGTTGREILDWWPSGQGNYVLHIQFGEQIVDPTVPMELQIQLDVI